MTHAPRPTKLLHLIGSIDPKHGGVINGVTSFAKVRLDSGISTTVVSLDVPGSMPTAGLPFEFIPLGGATRSTYGRTAALTPWLLEHAGSFNGIVIEGLWQYHSFAARTALSRIGKPYVVFPHGMLDPWFKHSYPLKHVKKMLYWPWAEYRVLRDAAAVLFTCDEERRLARTSFWPYHATEEVVGFGTLPPPPPSPMQAEAFFAACPLAHGRRILLYLSRIHPKKGCDLLITAFAALARAHPDVHIVMAGPDHDGMSATLQATAASLGIAPERISWPGMLQGDAKWGAFYAAEAFILPSHQENFGIAVVEALACGTPVLITREVQIWREIVAAGGGVADQDTTQGITRLLESWLNRSPADWSAMKSQAVACFTAHFEMASINSHILRVMAARNALS
jgi:glycosyltransferase involved in cell wall biosynthesis